MTFGPWGSGAAALANVANGVVDIAVPSFLLVPGLLRSSAMLALLPSSVLTDAGAQT